MDNNQYSDTQKSDDFDPFAGPQIQAVYPLTPAQREIWVSCCMSTEASLAYNESFSVELQGVIKPSILKEALKQLAQRHELLNASVSPDGASFIITDQSPKLEIINVSDRSSGEREVAKAEIISSVQQRPYVLDKGPLFKFVLCIESESRYLFVIGGHHIACDGWSLDVLLHNISHLYDDLRGHTGSSLQKVSTLTQYHAALELLRQSGTVDPRLSAPILS